MRERIGLSPDLELAIDALTEAGFLPSPFRAQHHLLTRLLVAARLLAPDGKPPAGQAQRVLASACGAADFATLLRLIEEARHGIATTWAETFGERLEKGT